MTGSPTAEPLNIGSPKIHPQAWVAESAVVMGDVEIAEGASLWPTAVARGDLSAIVIGPGSNVQDGAGCMFDVARRHF